jgi:hypothetical protein
MLLSASADNNPRFLPNDSRHRLSLRLSVNAPMELSASHRDSISGAGRGSRMHFPDSNLPSLAG